MMPSRPLEANTAETRWRGHRTALLANDQIRCCVLENGGGIAHLGFVDVEGRAQRNALWESPWWSEGAPLTTEEELVRSYGDLGSGRFLQNFTGHALCLDSFGPASDAAVEAGSGLHGEASIVRWKLLVRDATHVSAQAYLPFAQIEIERDFELVGNETVLRVRESVTPRQLSQTNIHWVQHATVGPPLFGPMSQVSTSARVGMSCSEPYDGGNLLVEGRSFTWPLAPMLDGGVADLRQLFAHPGTGFLVALRQPKDARYGFVAVTDTAKGTSLIYVFVSDDFPWLTFWEENCCRKDFPWMGKVQARGLEFGTTPWPFGNERNDAAGPVLDTPTSRRVRSGEAAVAPWIMALATTPGHWNAIEDVIVERDRLLLCNGVERFSVRAQGVQAFLDGREAKG